MMSVPLDAQTLSSKSQLLTMYEVERMRGVHNILTVMLQRHTTVGQKQIVKSNKPDTTTH